MQVVKTIRTRLGLTQAQLGAALGVTQGNVGNYELRGQVITPPVAAKLIKVAGRRGLVVSFDDIYRQLMRSPKRSVRPKAVPEPKRSARTGAEAGA